MGKCSHIKPYSHPYASSDRRDASAPSLAEHSFSVVVLHYTAQFMLLILFFHTGQHYTNNHLQTSYVYFMSLIITEGILSAYASFAKMMEAQRPPHSMSIQLTTEMVLSSKRPFCLLLLKRLPVQRWTWASKLLPSARMGMLQAQILAHMTIEIPMVQVLHVFAIVAMLHTSTLGKKVLTQRLFTEWHRDLQSLTQGINSGKFQ